MILPLVLLTQEVSPFEMIIPRRDLPSLDLVDWGMHLKKSGTTLNM